MIKFLKCLLFYTFFPISAFATDMDISIHPMENFSGLTTKAILEKRIDAVKNSIFSNKTDYIPNSSVFQIEDGLPWISAHEITCYGHGTNGPSRESFAILNPALLYYPLMAAYNFSKTTGCSEVDYLLPYKMTYDSEKNIISAHIDYTSFFNKNHVFYRIHLSDTNARDLGFNYVFSPLATNIKFAETQNITTTITPTRGFYHRGGSCGVDGGCNNYSPRQYELEFYLTALPAEIDFNLWENYPSSDTQKPDILYKLFFD